MLSYILFFLSNYLCVNTARNLPKTNRVVDMVHEYFPMFRFSHMSDFLVCVQVVYTYTQITWAHLSEFCVCMAFIQICRILCFSTTILPQLRTYSSKQRFYGLNGSGTEYIFSGHASYTCLCTLYLLNLGFSWGWLGIYNLLTQFLIIASRNHYTVDIILAWIIVPICYSWIGLCKQVENCSRGLHMIV